MNHVGVAVHAGDRSDIDDAAIAALDHAAQHGLRAVHHAHDVDADELFPFGGGRVYKGRPAAPQRGVVDQDVDSAEMFDGLRNGGLHGGFVAHVAGERQRVLRVIGLELLLERGERLGVVVEQHELCAQLAEADGARAPDAHARAGDHRNFSLKSHGLLPPL